MKRRWMAIVAPLLLLFPACQDEGSSLSTQGAASSEYWFDSLPKMVATSDIVVLGTVTDVTKGITEGSPPEEIQLHRSDLRVDESLLGSVSQDSTVTIETLELVSPQPDWRNVDNVVLAFLKLSTEPDTPGMYYPINEQSVYLVTGMEVKATTEHDPFSERVAEMTLDELRNEILEAAQAVASGEIKPQQPFGV